MPFEIKHFCSVSSLQVAYVSFFGNYDQWSICMVHCDPPLVGAVINIHVQEKDKIKFVKISKMFKLKYMYKFRPTCLMPMRGMCEVPSAAY